jgi:uncharacterized protein
VEQEQVLYSKDLVKEICATLLSDSPDITSLQLEKNLNLSPENARTLIYRAIAQLNASLFPPLTQLELILTEGCNLACTYCFEKDMLGYKSMSLDIAKAAVDLLFEYSQKEQAVSITYFGGEPTLNFSAIQKVTEYAEQKASLLGKSVDFNTTSNGTMLSKSMVDYFALHNIAVLLSIDGLESTHNRYRIDKHGRGTFDRVMRGLEILKGAQQRIMVKITVMPENVQNLFENVLGLYEMGVKQFNLSHATGLKWSREYIDLYGEQLSRLFRWYKQNQDLRITEFDEIDMAFSYFGCRAGRNSIAVSINGEISPCSKIMALNNKQLIAKLGDVQYGLTHLRNRLELLSCLQLRSACEARGIDKDFQGGCFASNYNDNNSLFQPSMQEHTFSKLKRTIC